MSKDPLPEMGERKSVFQTEHTFMLQIMRRRNAFRAGGDVEQTAFFQYLQDISSTRIAREVYFAYGLADGQSHTDEEVARSFGVIARGLASIRRRRGTAIQTLWFLHGQEYPREQFSFARILGNYYLPREAQLSEDTTNRAIIAKRAEHNLLFYEDQQFLLAKEDELYKLLFGLYGIETVELFFRHYRLGEYRHGENFERSGLPHSKSMLSEQRVRDALEKGRATAEYLNNLPLGTRAWTPTYLTGSLAPTYRRRGLAFFGKLAEYQRQLEIARRLQDETRKNVLSPLERELLSHTSAARLKGETRTDGLRRFMKDNPQYPGNIEIDTVADLEGNLLEGESFQRLVYLRRLKNVSEMLQSPDLRKKIATVFADILYDYHVEEMSTEGIAEQLEIPVATVKMVKTFIEKLLWGTSVRRGDVTAAMIDSSFHDDTFPQPLERALSLCSQHISLPVIQAEIEREIGNLRLHEQHIVQLRRLVDHIVKQSKLSLPQKSPEDYY